MKCGTRKSMVVVMPAVAEHGDRQEEIVTAVVVATVRAGSKQMAERVHAPDRVMPECNPNQAAPQESIECTAPATDEPIPERGRNCQPQKNPHEVEAIQPHQHPIFDQLWNIQNPVVDLRSEEPADMRMPACTKCVP